jgi:hypothetical protein
VIDGGLRNIFKEKMPWAHWQAIETGAVGLGVPDSNVCFSGRELWVEFKKTDHWAVTMRPEQIGWISRRTRLGGCVFIAIRRAQDELWLVDGKWVKELAAGGLKWVSTLEGHHVWRGGRANWDWPEISRLFFGCDGVQ